jgi:hypothetical protein
LYQKVQKRHRREGSTMELTGKTALITGATLPVHDGRGALL